MDDWDSGSEVAFSDAPSSSQDHYVTDDDETRPAKVDAKQYKVLDSASLKAAQVSAAPGAVPTSHRADGLNRSQRRDLDQVRDVLGVNMHQAQTLLIHYRWNVENLFGMPIGPVHALARSLGPRTHPLRGAGFMTEAGQEELFRRAGLVTRTDETSTAGVRLPLRRGRAARATVAFCFP